MLQHFQMLTSELLYLVLLFAQGAKNGKVTQNWIGKFVNIMAKNVESTSSLQFDATQKRVCQLDMNDTSLECFISDLNTWLHIPGHISDPYIEIYLLIT